MRIHISSSSYRKCNEKPFEYFISFRIPSVQHKEPKPRAPAMPSAITRVIHTAHDEIEAKSNEEIGKAIMNE